MTTALEAASSNMAPGNDGTSTAPLPVMFVNTHLSVGGAETLLVNIIRKMDRRRFAPELCCLKHLGPLGEQLAAEVPAHSHLLGSKFDLAVLPRLARRMRERNVGAVVTVGTGGDKMFWGRLAAWRAGVPVVLSALHSTGLPDRVEWPNRLLARWTDGFIAVADAHARYLAESEGCPPEKVFVVPNGVDVDRFAPREVRPELREELALAPNSPVAIIVAALRPEKNHELFLQVAQRVQTQRPDARFLIVGDGPRRAELESLSAHLGLTEAAHFLGIRNDVPELLNLADVAVLTSKMEANPVSLLEAMAAGVPVVAPRVGSIPETVLDGRCGHLVEPENADQAAQRWLQLMTDRDLAPQLGRAARDHVVDNWSLESMVAGYEELIARLYHAKTGRSAPAPESQNTELTSESMECRVAEPTSSA